LFEPSVLAKTRQIDIEVAIDDTGHVTGAHLVDSPEDVDSTVATAVVGVARQWIFYPAKVNGKNVPSKHVIVFRFVHS
jgi:outer membrane biosynthesis protein TonB